MPTISEPQWPIQDEKTQAIIEDFLQGHDSATVFGARLYGNGMRGEDLRITTGRAIKLKAERDTKPEHPAKVLVMERDGNSATLRFINAYYAGRAVEMLRRQPNVIFANRVEN